MSTTEWIAKRDCKSCGEKGALVYTEKEPICADCFNEKLAMQEVDATMGDDDGPPTTTTLAAIKESGAKAAAAKAVAKGDAPSDEVCAAVGNAVVFSYLCALDRLPLYLYIRRLETIMKSDEYMYIYKHMDMPYVETDVIDADTGKAIHMHFSYSGEFLPQRPIDEPYMFDEIGDFVVNGRCTTDRVHAPYESAIIDACRPSALCSQCAVCVRFCTCHA